MGGRESCQGFEGDGRAIREPRHMAPTAPDFNGAGVQGLRPKKKGGPRTDRPSSF